MFARMFSKPGALSSEADGTAAEPTATVGCGTNEPAALTAADHKGIPLLAALDEQLGASCATRSALAALPAPPARRARDRPLLGVRPPPQTHPGPSGCTAWEGRGPKGCWHTHTPLSAPSSLSTPPRLTLPYLRSHRTRPPYPPLPPQLLLPPAKADALGPCGRDRPRGYSIDDQS